MNVGKRLTEGNVYRNYIVYSVPLILSSVLANLYSTVDAVIAGKYIGEVALGAISATGSVENILNALFGGFAGGFSVYLSNLFGRRDYKKIKHHTLSTIIFIAGLAAVIGGLGIVFRNPILDYLNVDPVLRQDAEIYFIISMGGSIISYACRILAQVLPAMGITSYTLYIAIGSSLLNIAGNILTVTVFNMGVAGLAIATIFSTLCQLAVYAVLFFLAFRKRAESKTGYRFRFSHVTCAFRYTLPAAAQMVAFHGVNLVIAPLINGLGAAVTTGDNVGSRVYSLTSLAFFNMTSAISCYTAQCVGEGNYKIIPRGLRAGFILNGITLIPGLVVCTVLGGAVVSIFFPDGFAGDSFEYALRFVQIYMPFVLLIQMVDHVLHAYLRSLGAFTPVFWVSLLGSAVRIVTIFWLTPTMHIDGVYLSQILSLSADMLATLILFLSRYRTTEHIQKRTQKLV